MSLLGVLKGVGAAASAVRDFMRSSWGRATMDVLRNKDTQRKDASESPVTQEDERGQ